MNKWISVKDRLPATGTDVLITGTRCGCEFMDVAQMGAAHVDSYAAWLLTDSICNTCGKQMDYYKIYEVTHWMPLPGAPNE